VNGVHSVRGVRGVRSVRDPGERRTRGGICSRALVDEPTFSPAAFAEIPVAKFFGFELQRCDATSATVALRPRPEHAQMFGVVHGGVVATLADTAAVFTTYPFLAPGERMTSIEFKVNFLAGATPAKGDVVATAEVVRRGRRVVVVRSDVRQGEQLVATGLFTYLLTRDRDSS
jgi:uncharacterized protein (TIGR00369 family)